MTAHRALDRTVRLIHDAVSASVADHEIVNRLQSARIRIVADERNLRSHAGQCCLVTLASLVARMGVQVAVAAPDVDLVGAQPPLRGPRLHEALIDFGMDVIPGTSIVIDNSSHADMTFVLGDSFAPAGANFWRVSGSEWSGRAEYLGSKGKTWDFAWPIGAMTAAALAATEVFKTTIRSFPLRPVWDEMLAPCLLAEWDFEGAGGMRPSETALSVDFISAGAITQSALYCLCRAPVPLALRVFDDDVHDETNLNRQMLSRRSDGNSRKVDIVAKYCEPFQSCHPIGERFSEFTEAKYLPHAAFTLIGVDHIPSRWFAQRVVSGWLGVGATTHFEVSTSSHERWQPCAACLHPVDDLDPNPRLPTVSFVSFWAGLGLAVRFLKRIADQPCPNERQHLWIGTLRMGDPNAARFMPVAPRPHCPVHCTASKTKASGHGFG